MGSVGNIKGKSFSTLTVAQKRERIKDFKKSLDSRFKHYQQGKYDIYNVGDRWAAYNFNPTDERLAKYADESYLAVRYEKTLKALKANLGG